MYVNVDGLFWHSIKVKDKKYHFDMREAYEKNNMRIFQFWEDEMRDKGDIVASIVHANEGLCKRVFARKTNTAVVSQNDASKFLKENHLMGSINAKHVGLYHDKQLVSIFSYKTKNETLIIERFCNAKNLIVVGGLSKLISWGISNTKCAQVESWVDLRYGNGESLRLIGFQPIRTTQGWKWTDGRNTFNRLKCRANMDERKLSEKEYAEELGWYKIYDAGQRLFQMKVS